MEPAEEPGRLGIGMSVEKTTRPAGEWTSSALAVLCSLVIAVNQAAIARPGLR